MKCQDRHQILKKKKKIVDMLEILINNSTLSVPLKVMRFLKIRHN